MTGNSEMVERVKAALLKKANEVNIRDFTEAFARAAIEAMMEPTEAMLLACWPLHHPWGIHAPSPADRPEGVGRMKEMARADWQAMLSEALSPSLKEQDRTP